MKASSGIIIDRLKIGEPAILRSLKAGILGILVLATISCGGSSSSGGNNNGGGSPNNNPAPIINSLSPSSIPAGSAATTLTVIGSGFISSSVINWNGSSRTTTYVSSLQLRTTLSATDIATAGTASVTVFTPTPGGGTSAALLFTIKTVSPLSIVTTILPNASHIKSYNYPLEASGGIPPYTWSVVSGTFPSGLSLPASGVISGTPPSLASDTPFTFVVQVADSASSPHTSVQTLTLLVRSGVLGRNDSCPATLPAITNGTIRASISPYGDVDVYSFQGTSGSRITAEIFAQRLQIYANSTTRDVFLDSFLELLDSNCGRLTYNDDISASILDSKISSYTLPSTGTYYLRVSDMRGDGRPDFIYELDLSGAN